jgi:hypothetical protein
MRLKRQPMIYLIIMTLVFGMLLQTPTYAVDENLAEVSYVGPGRYETDLLIIEGGETNQKYEVVGTAAVWNTRNELVISLGVEEGMLIKDVMIYAGNEEIPVSEGGNPKVEKFPYGEKYKNGTDSCEISIKLVEELGISWGMRDETNRMPKLSICARVEEEDSKKGSQYFAWAEGNYKFDVNSGWWMRYAVVHPKTGHFIDSPVEGVQYETPTHRGKTDEGGAFEYIQGEDVNLYIGSTFIGDTKADQKITPMDLVGTDDMYNTAVKNMAKLLQSFDEDGEPNAGITIPDETAEAFDEAVEEMELREINFYDSEEVNELLALTDEKLDGDLNIVSEAEALDNLEKGTGSSVVRKNVSKASDYENTKAKLEFAQFYVPAQKANGDPVKLEYYETVIDEFGKATEEENLIMVRDKVKPLVSCYTQLVDESGAEDIIAAISRDEGETWKTANLSKSADKSSFTLADGTEFMGDTHKPQIRLRGNYVLAVWTSKYAKSGKPTYAIKIDDEESEDHYEFDDPYYEEDIWGVSGPQRSCDYSEDYPEVGELPYSVVWACRGVINEETGDVTWYKPERLTSGRRDANQIMMNGMEGAGFAVTWQEDPEGLRPGENAGPGEGWSGATTNHKTDIWYSYILWDDFAKIDENFESKGAAQYKEEEDEELRGRPKALVPMKLPVRMSDNDNISTDNMMLVIEDGSEEATASVNSAIKQSDFPDVEGTWVDVDNLSIDDLSHAVEIVEGKMQGTHQYGYVNLAKYYDYCDKYDGIDDKMYYISNEFYYERNQQGADKYIAITDDGRLMDGNTGASRPNIMMQKYMKTVVDEEGNPVLDENGKKTTVPSAWVTICYEETKGVGAGPPDDMGSTTSEEGIALEAESIDGYVDTLASATTNTEEESVEDYAVESDAKGNSSDNGKIGRSDTSVEDLDLDDEVDTTASATTSNEETSVSSDSSSSGQGSSDGVGEQKGKNSYVADEGKNVIYHTFDLAQPDLVSAGTIINPHIVIDIKFGEEDDNGNPIKDLEDCAEYEYYASKYAAWYRDNPEYSGSDLPGMVNDVDADDYGTLYLTDESGDFLCDWDGTPLLAYENARRPRMLIQSKSAAIAGKDADEKGTVMVMLYKMGEDGKGRPSDIFMTRWEVCANDKGNPYAVEYKSEDNFNISSVSIGDTLENENRSDSSKGEGLKVLNWSQGDTDDESLGTYNNLDDDSWENPNDDARAHRGILRGDTLAIALDYTPNWAAARNGNDNYDIYLRRSFNGGQDFTTNPDGKELYEVDGETYSVKHTEIFKVGLGTGEGSQDRAEDEVMKEFVDTYYKPGDFEPMRNLSLLTNNKKSVIEPRLVGGQGTIADSPYDPYNEDNYEFYADYYGVDIQNFIEDDPIKGTFDKSEIYYEDKRNTNMFWVTYGTSTNPAKGSTELKEPMDLYYSYTTDFGDTFHEVTKTIKEDSKGNNAGDEVVTWDWLAKDTGQKKSAQAECQIRMPADGSALYAVWNESGHHGSDVMFRRIMPGGINIQSVIEEIDETAPVITIEGIQDGEIVNEDVTLDIDLNELGTYTAELTSGGSTSLVEDEITIEAGSSKRDYKLKITAEDLSGNKGEKEISFTVDGRVPNINIFGVKNNMYSQNYIELQVSTSGESEVIRLKRNGKYVDVASTALLTEEGDYELEVISEEDGNVAKSNVKYTIDRTAPGITFIGVEDGGIYVGSVRPEVIVTDNLSKTLKTLEIKLNGLDYLSATNISREGDYTLYVYAVDKAGNTSVSEISFEVVN